MRLAVLLGIAVGLAAIVLGWRARAHPALSVAQARAVPAATRVPPASDLEILRSRSLLVPVAGLGPQHLRDSFAEPRGGHLHQAIDILAPRGTRVLAADDGTVVRLLRSSRGGLTVYQNDPTSSYCYYYAHLAGYALGLREGQQVRRGDTLGFVGTTGNAPPQTPHLHFAVSRLGPDARCSSSAALNPFALWAR